MRCQNAYTLHGFDCCCSFLKLIELDNILAIHSSGTDLDPVFQIQNIKYTKNKQTHTKHRENGLNTTGKIQRAIEKTRVSLCKRVQFFISL